MKLTKRSIDVFKYQGDGQSRDVRWDDAMRGFGVRIYPSGQKAFVLSYRADGRKRLLTLGTYGRDFTLDQARDEARKKIGKVLDGDDPVGERRNGGDSFSELAKVYLERHARPNKKSADADERAINKELLPTWGNRKATDIKRRDVIELLDSIKDRGSPVMANRILALARKIFNFGIGRDIVDMNPCAQVLKPFKEQPRQRVLNDDELCTLWNVFDDLGPLVGPMFKLRTLTLQRGTEIASMRWEDIEGDWWTIPGHVAKNGLSHRVPLSPQAITILEEIKQYRDSSGWVFPSPSRPGAHISNIKKAALRANAMSGIKDCRPHDLRRSGASKLTGLGIPRLVVSKILNHVETGVTAVYDRHSYDPEKRHALELWGQYVESLAAGKPVRSNVVELATA